MRRLHGLLTTAFLTPFMLLPPPLSAQTAFEGAQEAQSQGVWVQIEAMPTLSRAQDRVRAYGARLGDVAGFDLGNGWYGVVLGPYAPEDAEAVLRRLRALGDIPADSYITDGAGFTRQYWPVGANNNQGLRPLPGNLGTMSDPVAVPTVVTGDPMLDALAADLAAAVAGAAPLPDPDADAVTTDALPLPDALIETEADIALPEITAPAAPLPDVVFPNAPAIDETERQALASEALLTRTQKEALQIALQWAGVYTGAIDGAYGRGTRNAMAAWQSAQGKPATGVLTTRERADLLAAYGAVLTNMGLALVSDPEAGIEVIMPTDAVAHSDTAAPFVTYGATGVVAGAQVILLSQPGDQRRLAGLYEIMQTLDSVPAAATRSLTATGFSILGGNDRIQSYTHAVLADGAIKGFTLVWPAGDQRFTRLWQEMRNSFTPIAGVLPAVAVAVPDPATLDLASGLALRQPRAVGAGVFVNAAGAVLTDAGLVAQCDRIAIAGDYAARVTHQDGALAVLTPDSPIAPPAIARFAARAGQGGRLAVAGYPYGSALLAPTLTFGAAAGTGGLAGEAGVTRLAIAGAAGDRGGPVLDASGAVVGLYTLPQVPAGQILPAGIGFMQDAATVMASLSRAGISHDLTQDSAEIPVPTLTRRAGEMVVQVACW